LRPIPFVPHIVHPPSTTEDLRVELGIPDDAVVFGRHGAADAFNIEFVQRAVIAAVEERREVWFIFLNTNRFATHERVVHIPRVDDREDVSRFVNTCDYMIHALAHGENFGLAVAEFAVAGVPVMAFLDAAHRAHFDLLSPGLLIGYRDYDDVLHSFRTLEPRVSPVPSDIATRYGTEAVMKRFASVFLD
jgi:hypothetical protein